ncbi:YbaB/EbfC family nucleoid-associated protein [Actinophytocola sp. NPDC049390]|uniref:YbaB/EbfC family nucleoid-associated protein n=1 Tax=Actinophytocola sp. NPDC049390 TaxID=3363894 RepID=UPI003798F0DA
MDDRVLSPDDARERLEAWQGKIEKLAADTKDMSDRFQALQVTRSDPNRMAEVTVDSTGSLIALRLTREIERSSPEVVAATIMSTIRAAKVELAGMTQEIIEDTVGAESSAGQAIAARVSEHLLANAGEVEPDGEYYDRHEDEEQRDISEPLRSDSRPTPRAGEDEEDDDTTIWR